MILFLPLIFLFFFILFAVSVKTAVIVLILLLLAIFSFWFSSFLKKVNKNKKDVKESALAKIEKDKLLGEISPLLAQSQEFLEISEFKNSNLYFEFSKLNSYLLKLEENVIQKKHFDEKDKEYFYDLKSEFEELQKHRALGDFKLLEVF